MRAEAIEHADRAGWVESRRARQTGLEVSLYRAAEAGIESDPASPWATVCETHSTVIVHRSRSVARGHMADPCGWCSPCRARRDGVPCCPRDGEPLERRSWVAGWVCPSCYREYPEEQPTETIADS